jgi:hypothetical protein
MRQPIAALVSAACLLALGCAGESLGTKPDAKEEEADAATEQPDAKVAADAMEKPDARVADAAQPADAKLPDAAAAADAAASADAAPGADAASPDAGGGGTNGCFTDPGVTQVGDFSTIFYAQTYAGATDKYVFNSNQCSDMPNSAERIYSFELTEATEWYAETRCGTGSSWDCELVLTRDGCTDANVVDCQTTIGDEIMKGVLQPGKYALFVEGDNPEDPAVFDLMVNFNHTEGEVNCVSETLNVINPANCTDPVFESPQYHVHYDGLMLSPDDRDDFFVDGSPGCDHDQDHVGGGPDKVYKLVLPTQHEVKITFEPDGGWDGILYITGAPCGAKSAVHDCSDSILSSSETIDTTLPAGTWYIVVDGFGEEVFNANAWGTFSLDVKVYDDACNT